MQYAVFSTRVIALDIHWMAWLWKTVIKKHSSRSYTECLLIFFPLWLHSVTGDTTVLEYTQAFQDKLVMETGIKNGSCHWKIQFGSVELQWVI